MMKLIVCTQDSLRVEEDGARANAQVAELQQLLQEKSVQVSWALCAMLRTVLGYSASRTAHRTPSTDEGRS